MASYAFGQAQRWIKIRGREYFIESRRRFLTNDAGAAWRGCMRRDINASLAYIPSDAKLHQAIAAQLSNTLIAEGYPENRKCLK